MAKIGQTRRTFIASLAGFLGLLALGRYLTPRSKVRRQLLAVPIADLPAEGALVYRQERIAVVRSNSELYALGLVCTHLGCTVSVTADELVCPCHGSRFDRNGMVLKGPADRPLPRYQVERRGDRVIVLA
jgi:Rieske Fe-S protein